MNPTLYPDTNIPVLTEVISREDGTATPAVEEVIEQTNEQTTPPVVNNLAFSLEELEKTLRENVLRQLLTRVDFVLEHRVRDSLADVLQTAADNLASEIRQGLANSLEELIHRAVSQEISKIQSLNSQN